MNFLLKQSRKMPVKHNGITWKEGSECLLAAHSLKGSTYYKKVTVLGHYGLLIVVVEGEGGGENSTLSLVHTMSLASLSRVGIPKRQMTQTLSLYLLGLFHDRNDPNDLV